MSKQHIEGRTVMFRCVACGDDLLVHPDDVPKDRVCADCRDLTTAVLSPVDE